MSNDAAFRQILSFLEDLDMIAMENNAESKTMRALTTYRLNINNIVSFHKGLIKHFKFVLAHFDQVVLGAKAPILTRLIEDIQALERLLVSQEECITDISEFIKTLPQLKQNKFADILKLKIEFPVLKFEMDLFKILVELLDACSKKQKDKIIRLCQDIDKLVLNFHDTISEELKQSKDALMELKFAFDNEMDANTIIPLINEVITFSTKVIALLKE